MMRYYANPTENTAVGAVDKELRRMQKLAKRLRRLRDTGRFTTDMEQAAWKLFTGIYRRFLVEALR
ncbi:MAG: hypothetical protein E7459_10860 [Ruminococcaceae bacterium]|nr:hypothetical protein [Oscillospiraceae bacterium]